MATLNAKDVEQSLLRKGFIRDNDRHRIFWFHHNGERKPIRTMTSHNKQDIDVYLQGEMSRQMCLTKKEFVAFVSCTISGESYVKLMRERGKV